VLQSVVRAIYPPQCISCGVMTEAEFGLCALCWREMTFADGLVCDLCGVPLVGPESERAEHCDDCLVVARPWTKGRAAFVYSGTGRKLVLALKHGDRTDIARIAGPMLKRAAAPLLRGGSLLVPVPLHWTRMLGRRFNQSALLAQALGAATGQEVAPLALIRTRRTKPLEGHSRDARFEALDNAIRPHPRHGAQMKGRNVIIIDDVMTSGATMAAAADAAAAAGATNVFVLALARVAKDT
jgi:ComF family protein